MDMIPSTEFQITPKMLQMIAEIEAFRGQWKATTLLSRETLRQLRSTATIESIGSSTRIEGSTLTDEQVRDLLSNLGTQSFHTRDTQEVAGYAELMNMIFESWQDIPITENHIKQFHTILLTHSEKDERHRGKYKTLANTVAAFDTSGKEIGIIFATASPFDTPRSMEALLGWYDEACRDNILHPLLIIAIFIVWFLAIHPFQDGNGRLSRILTTFLLLKSGYAYVPFVSMESIVEQNKDRYYASLRSTQATFSLKQPNWEPWILFFLRSLLEQTRRLSKKIEHLKTTILPPILTTRILELFELHKTLTVIQCEEILETSRNTIKLHLSKLVKNGQLAMHGKGRGVFYTRL